MTHAKTWSEDDRDQLVQLAGQGKSVDEIAALMGRSAMAIEAKARSLKVKVVGYKRSASLKKPAVSSPFGRVFG